MNPAEFEHIARAEEHLWWYRGQRRILYRLLDPIARERKFHRVLEAGCGTGYQSKDLADRYGWPMTPLDLGWLGLEYARGFGLERLTQGDVGQLPYRDAAFDAVLSLDVIVHFHRGDDHRAFSELARVTRPGGLCVIRVSALDILRSRHSMHAHEHQRFTAPRLRASLEQAGFRVDRLTYANSLLLPIALFKFRVWEPLTNAAPASGVDPVALWLDTLLHAPLALESSLIGSGLDLPVGQSLIAIATRN